MNEFFRDTDSTILVRERARGSKFESLFRRQRRGILNESLHTLSFLLSGKATSRLLSKRNVALAPQMDDKEQSLNTTKTHREVTNQNEVVCTNERNQQRSEAHLISTACLPEK